jgi:cellulose synthase/poly-beta-1,6-N-acetylglucosamine synthase-like glycosyltransferase
MERAMPIMSVVIATRDRHSYLERLLRCLQDQDLRDFECIVVDDGSGEETLAAYGEIWKELDARFQLHRRADDDRQPGGPSRARNKGIALAKGTYVAFCDDDDRWVRNDHLSTAVRAMTNQGAELFFAAMQTATHGKVDDPDLYAPARKALQRHKLASEPDVYLVSQAAMTRMLRHRTLHTDTIVAARSLLFDAGLYWEKTSLAEDRDFSFRLVDRARKILFRSTVAGELNVTNHVSVYRSYATQEKALFASLASLHSEIEVRNPRLRRLARAVRAWDMLELSRALVAEGKLRHAREFAAQSFLLYPSMSALRSIVQSWRLANVR